MWYKPYGQTGKKISVVGFGGMRFPKENDHETNAELVKYAYDRKINYFDTAPGYGDSEDIFGIAFKEMDRSKYYISTKSNKADGVALRNDLDNSLRRMNVAYVDFFHIWCVVTKEQFRKRIEGGAIDAALRAKKEGLIKHLVISSHLPGEQLAEVLEQGPFEGVTLGYCAINFPYRERAVEAAGDMGLGVVTMNPLGGGLIPEHADRFEFIKSEYDPSVVAAAIRFNVSHPAITSALVGFSNKDHVEQAVDAVTDFQPYDRTHIEKIRENVLGEMDELCTSCGYCLPCPQGVPISRLMESYNLKILGGDDKDIQNRLKYHWNLDPEEAQACSLCGACEERCTQRLDIRERLKCIASLKDKQE